MDDTDRYAGTLADLPFPPVALGSGPSRPAGLNPPGRARLRAAKMDRLQIKGGRRLEGTVKVSGAKNAALPILAATLLAEGEHTLTNVPDLADVRTLLRLLGRIGAYGERGSGRGRHKVTVEVSTDIDPVAEYDLVKTMRASVLVLGPLLARHGRARVSLPGGCAIGARPIDLHLQGLAALGADIRLAHGYVEAKARRLKGGRFTFDAVSVTGTENVLMAAALARGQSVLENCAREPEVTELARVLVSMGARIEGIGTDTLIVDGVDRDALRPMHHAIGPDRIEAGTLAVAAALTGGDVLLERCEPGHLDALVDKLEECGATVTPVNGSMRVRGPSRPRGVDVRTSPYPGFPTDMQAQVMALCTVAEGSSVIREQVFENRFMHVSELGRMGADVRVDGHTAHVKGVSGLSGAPVMATDLRASASLVLAGLRAEGTTVVHRVYHLDRGYERLERKLRGLGADIRRLTR
jgi:UDP-N-acetylglucosamine 1-carboxyvinyltransferase